MDVWRPDLLGHRNGDRTPHRRLALIGEPGCCPGNAGRRADVRVLRAILLAPGAKRKSESCRSSPIPIGTGANDQRIDEAVNP